MKRTALRGWLLAGAFACVILPASDLNAQRPDSVRSEQDRSRLEERIRARVAEIIRERLGLDADQEARLSAIFETAEADRRELAANEREARRSIAALVETGSANSRRAREILDTLLDLKEREVELYRSEQDHLLEVITPYQLLQLHQIRVELGRRIRELRRGRSRGEGSRGGSTTGPGGGEGHDDGASGPHPGGPYSRGSNHEEPHGPGF